MHIPKNYFQDKVILLLASLNVFLTVLITVLTLTRLNIVSGGNFIVQYRANLGTDAFKSGGLLDMLTFIIFAVVVATVQITLSVRTYSVKRQLSAGILGIGVVLLLLCLVVSNALLAVH